MHFNNTIYIIPHIVNAVYYTPSSTVCMILISVVCAALFKLLTAYFAVKPYACKTAEMEWTKLSNAIERLRAHVVK